APRAITADSRRPTDRSQAPTHRRTSRKPWGPDSRLFPLRRRFAGVLTELGDEPRVRAADAIRAARAEIRCAQNVRTEETGEGDRTGESPANEVRDPPYGARSRAIPALLPARERHRRQVAEARTGQAGD